MRKKRRNKQRPLREHNYVVRIVTEQAPPTSDEVLRYLVKAIDPEKDGVEVRYVGSLPFKEDE